MTNEQDFKELLKLCHELKNINKILVEKLEKQGLQYQLIIKDARIEYEKIIDKLVKENEELSKKVIWQN